MPYIIHNFHDSRFPQSDNDQTIAGVTIPKGYVNASLMCKNYGKEIKRFMEIKSTKDYIIALEKDINKVWSFKSTIQETTENIEVWMSSAISITPKNNVPNQYRGVWMHPELAIKLASWLSPEFEVWANRTLRLVIEDKVKTIEFDDAQRQLQWEWLRTQSKLARRKFTDCLKDMILKEHGDDFYHSYESAKLFAMYTAIAQRELTGFPNFTTEEQLDLLEKFEQSFVAKYEIDYPDESFDAIFHKVIRKLKKKLKKI